MDKFDGYEDASSEVIVLFPKNDTERFFGSEENRKFYNEAEAAVAKEKVDVGFDWRTLLDVLFGRVA